LLLSAGCHVQPAEAILPSSEEQWAGVLEVAKFALAKSAKIAAAAITHV
jgi:hypothetical protein